MLTRLRPTSFRFATALAVGALSLTACAGDEGAKNGGGSTETASEAPAEEGAKRLPDDTFDAACCEKRGLDLDKDGVADAYQFLQTVEEQVIVRRKEVDVNFDGQIDLIRIFDDTGELLAERLDTDFDGKVDVVNFFEDGAIVRKEYDTNFDGNTDVVRFYDKGVITRKEADLDHNGKVDYWEYYEGGKIDRVGIDRTGDGEVDEWETVSPT
jgi:hypothetical protein